MLERFTDLDEQLAVGSHPHAPEHVDQLAAAGVGAVLNLQTDDDLGERGVHWPLLWQLYVQRRIRVTRVPIVDHDRADLQSHLTEAVAELQRFVEAERKVYVHCSAGLNRSPTVLIGWLITHRGLSLGEAQEWLESRHSCVPYPDVLERWLAASAESQG